MINNTDNMDNDNGNESRANKGGNDATAISLGKAQVYGSSSCKMASFRLYSLSTPTLQ